MKKKSDKIRELEELRRELARTPHIFVTGFEKMTVQQDFELRRLVRKAGARYRVVKNTVAGKAAEDTPAKALLGNLTGMTSLAYTESDPVALAKTLTEYARANPTFTFKAGMVEGRVIEIKSIQELASMPSREELLAKLLFLIQAPAQRVAMAVNALGRNLAVVIDQGCKENKFKAE